MTNNNKLWWEMEWNEMKRYSEPNFTAPEKFSEILMKINVGICH